MSDSSLASTLIINQQPCLSQFEPTHVSTAEQEPGTVSFARLLPCNLVAQQLFDLMSVDSSYPQYLPCLRKGFYRLTLDEERATQRRAWVIGAGSSNSPTPFVDIQLYARTHFHSSRAVKEHIAASHASISIHPISGVLIIKNHTTKPITCTGYDSNGNITTSAYTIALGNTAHSSSTYVIHRRVTRLDFGPLSFNLEIESINYTAFIELRNKYLLVHKQSLPVQVIDPFILLDGARQLNPEEIVTIAEISSSLSAGVSLVTGDPYVIKQSVMKPNHSGREKEYGLMSVFSKQHLSQLVPTVCYPSQQPQEYDSATYTMDMALFSFYSYFTKHRRAVSNSEFLQYARNTLLGLQALHSMGTTHGNINPHTLLFLSSWDAMSVNRPLDMHAVICPILKSGPPDKVQGQPFIGPYLEGDDRYSQKADIWALGASWLWCLDMYDSISINPKDRILNTMAKLNDAIMRCRGARNRAFLIMVKDMMATNPPMRPAGEELLGNRLWIMRKDNPDIPLSHYKKQRATRSITKRGRRQMSV